MMSTKYLSEDEAAEITAKSLKISKEEALELLWFNKGPYVLLDEHVARPTGRRGFHIIDGGRGILDESNSENSANSR
jgi:hypothetical protein